MRGLFPFTTRELSILTNLPVVVIKGNKDKNRLFCAYCKDGIVFIYLNLMSGIPLLQARLQKNKIFKLIKKNLKEIIGTNQCLICFENCASSIILKKKCLH